MTLKQNKLECSKIFQLINSALFLYSCISRKLKYFHPSLIFANDARVEHLTEQHFKFLFRKLSLNNAKFFVRTNTPAYSVGASIPKRKRIVTLIPVFPDFLLNFNNPTDPHKVKTVITILIGLIKVLVQMSLVIIKETGILNSCQLKNGTSKSGARSFDQIAILSTKKDETFL